MKKLLILMGIPVVLAGCTLFKSERQTLIPNKPALNFKDTQVIREQAMANLDLAQDIEEFGTSAHSPKSITLMDGTEIIVNYLGKPNKRVNVKDIKESKKIIEKSRGVAEDYNKEVGKYEDSLDRSRDKQVNAINWYWDWKKLFGGGIITTIVVIGGLLIASVFYPILLPIIQIIWQLFRGGISAFGIFAKLGVTGVTNIVSSVERYREANKGTEAGKAFDAHMKTMPDSTKTALDGFKNHYDI